MKFTWEKRISPYHYWDNFEEFKESLPSKDIFYNTLTNRTVRNKSYAHVLNIWEAFRMNAMNDYHDLHLKIDVLLLACVSETFRKESIVSFGLDLPNYLSNPGCSWDATIIFTDVNLKLISDIGKYQFVESMIRSNLPISS